MRPACSVASFANTSIRICELALLRWTHSGCFGCVLAAVGAAGLVAAFDAGAPGCAGAAACEAGDFGAAMPGATTTAAIVAVRVSVNDHRRARRCEMEAYTAFLLVKGRPRDSRAARSRRRVLRTLGGQTKIVPGSLRPL